MGFSKFQETKFHSRWKRRDGGRDDIQERGRHCLDVLLVFRHVLISSFGRIQLEATARRQICHTLDERYDEISQIVVAVCFSECRQKSGAGGIASKESRFVVYR